MTPVPNMPDTKQQRRESEDRLGKDIIDESRVQLMLKFRFLDLALWRMDLEPLRVGAAYPLATDARKVYYDPPRVIARFQESFEESVRDYLHLVMHCVFRHPFDKDHGNAEAWSLTCDIVVEHAVMDMCGTRFVSSDDADRRQAISEIKMLVGDLLPNKIYQLVKNMVQTPDGQQYHGMGRSTLNEWHALFERDDHGAWPANNESGRKDDDDDSRRDSDDNASDEESDAADQSDAIQTETAGDEQPEDDDRPQNNQQHETEAEADDADSGADKDASSESAQDDDSQEEGSEDAAASARDLHQQDSEQESQKQEKEWEDISKEIEMNLETFSKEWGDEAGSLISNLSFANRKKYSYTDFLRQFMVVTEEMQLNMDEFDYLSYTYGMDLYGNMPLIEPLEYKETERVHDFVIAIDTSESVSGDLVKKFIEHTFDILKSSEDYASEVNIHIIQCDAKVQSDIKIKNLRDVDKMMEKFQVRGFGGTDFRPTFDYVDMLRKRGELRDIKGLVYFTDGLGQFPEKPPAFDAAFVFMDDGARDLPPVPPWACKIVIDEAGINQFATRADR